MISIFVIGIEITPPCYRDILDSNFNEFYQFININELHQIFFSRFYMKSSRVYESRWNLRAIFQNLYG